MGRIGNIINKKGKQDAKRAKIFTKHARAIAVAAKECSEVIIQWLM